MLERTAGCLETGNLRRIVPGPKRLLSRRMLHSTFWNHGATELEFSPLWQALNSKHDVVEEIQSRARFVSGSAGPFLDFLYPAGAMKILRRFSHWAPDMQENRIPQAGFARLGQRLYTSISAASRIASEDHCQFTIVALEDGQIGDKAYSTPTDHSLERIKHEDLLDSMLEEQTAEEYEKAWRLYQSTDAEYRQKVTARLWTYLSTSNRDIDIARSSMLFDQFKNFSGPEDYINLMTSLLITKNKLKALDVYDDVLKTFDIPIGSEILFASFLSDRDWLMAYELFVKYRKFGSSQPTLSYNIWANITRLPTLPDIAAELSAFAVSSRDKWPSIVSFAGTVAFKTLLSLAESNRMNLENFNKLLKLISVLKADSPKRYEALISALFKSGYNKVAVLCYRRFRQSSTERISLPTLHKVMNVFYRYQSVAGMKQVLDDWIRYYKRPAPHVYRMAMRMFASLGDAPTVNDLFEKYFMCMRMTGRKITSADDFAAVFHVHAIRGELAQVRKAWRNMKKLGVQPTVRAWNILINAYVKVNDIDRAQESFESLVLSGLKPDSYTYGTLMGACATRGDFDGVMHLYQLADASGVNKTSAMIDCIVLAHLQQDHLAKAEEVCEVALDMSLGESCTRMWNYLLNWYGMRRDLIGVSRILRRMKEVSVGFDEATYAALMQTLAMVKQPDNAYAVLKDMPKAGINSRSYHYAIVMGGYIANGEVDKVWGVYQRMLDRGLNATSSTRLMALKAASIQDQKIMKNDSHEARLKKAEQCFYEAYTSADRREVVGTLRKGTGPVSLDILAESSYFAFLIFVYGQRHAFVRVKQLYELYLGSIPENRQQGLPVKILSALMISNLNEGKFEAVQECWDLAFQQAVKEGQHLRLDLGTVGGKTTGIDEQSQAGVLRMHRFNLSIPLSTYMRSLERQDQLHKIQQTVEAMEKSGFSLDKKNWNLYVQILTRAGSRGYKQAFELCETKLMPRFTGWPRYVKNQSIRNRLPVELRALKKRPEHLRPNYHTLLLLAKAYMSIKDAATESRNASWLVNYLVYACPQTLRAVETLQRDNNTLERTVLAS